ncbi:MAG: hypothetical protein P4L85_25090 [Paludisphaera borealis]|nr:hypothetical protein [Paludisphaera borealis]MDR3622652.1 hypothetical protein [Paludisphaera borealis]
MDLLMPVGFRTGHSGPPGSLKVRDELQGAIAFEADDREVAAVGCEDGADVLPLGEMDQSGVGELEADRFMAPHDVGDGDEGVAVQGQDVEHAGGVGLGETVEGPVLLPQEPGGLGQYLPAGQERRRKRGEGINASAVVGVAGGQQGDQRASVKEDAAFSLWRRSLPCDRGWC